MTISSILTLLQAVLSLLLAVQSNPALPPSVSSSVIQLAQQVISEASQDLPGALQNSSGISAPVPSVQVTQYLQTPSGNVVPQQATSSSNAPAPTLSWLHFCPVIVPLRCSNTPAPVYDAYGCVTAYTCSIPYVQKPSQPTAETTTANPAPVTGSASCVAGNTTYQNGGTVYYPVQPGPGIFYQIGWIPSLWTCSNGQWISGTQSPPATNSSCVVQTQYCGTITVPNGSNAEDTRMCGVECLMQHCDNGVMEPGGTGSTGYVNLSCANEPYSE